MNNKNQTYIKSEDVPQLYKNHLKEILAFVYNYVHNEDDARELTQDIFYKFCLDVQNKKIKDINPRAYLFKIARNHCIDVFRKTKVKTSELNEEIGIPEDKETPEDRLIHKMLIQSVEKYINNNLSETEASVFKLKYYYNMNLEEISEVVNSSTSSISRMIRSITSQLKKNFPDIL